jgi:hypothetical protein
MSFLVRLERRAQVGDVVVGGFEGVVLGGS